MIIKNILTKIEVHYLNYILAIIVIITGMFKESLIIFFIIFVHELGHLALALIFKWQLDKIYIYPFGGCVTFNESLNRPLKEELLIMLAGPIFQIILFIIITILFKNNCLNLRTFLIFKNYHYAMLFFNLLPAIPLDGGRLLNILLNYLLSYKKSIRIASSIAYFVLFSTFFISLFINKNINLLTIIIFLISKVYIERKNIDYLYNKFLLERYLNNFRFNKRKIVDKNNLHRDYNHTIKDNNHYITEKEYLKKRFYIN